jgi:hypothetical protein
MTTPPINVLAALTGAANTAINTLTVPPEERLIIVAQGKEFRNGDHALPLSIPDSLIKPGTERAKHVVGTAGGQVFTLGETYPALKKLPAIPLVKRADGSYEYLNVKQGVRFIVKVVQDKDEFVKALQTPGAHVIYDGHARYGRGPCFGSGGYTRGEMWEEGTPFDPITKTATHPNKDGLFRMGFPFNGIEASEIREHGYTANLAEAGPTKPPASECDPDLAGRLGELKPRTLPEIDPAIIPYVSDPDPAKKWWSYGAPGKRHVVHIAGWQNTKSSPDDLGAITPTCRVFAHLGCSTKRHNRPIIRDSDKKNWVRSGNERYAYFTTAPSYFTAGHYWLQCLLTYDKFDAYQSWSDSLEAAKKKTNALLLKDNDHCQIY